MTHNFFTTLCCIATIVLPLCTSPLPLFCEEEVKQEVLQEKEVSSTQRRASISHKKWQAVLNLYVQNGMVDYHGLQLNPNLLNEYLDQLATVTLTEFKQWEEQEQIAFLLNLYNAATIKLIISNYPVDSIKDIGGIFSGPWSKRVVRLFGEKVSLDNIEHNMLRTDYQDPRIHFALVCAAISCPQLRDEPYTGRRLDRQLHDQGVRFLHDESKNYFNSEKNVLYLSSIFKWFRKDFKQPTGALRSFLRPFLPAEVPRGYRIRYMDYNWGLNDWHRTDTPTS